MSLWWASHLATASHAARRRLLSWIAPGHLAREVISYSIRTRIS